MAWSAVDVPNNSGAPLHLIDGGCTLEWTVVLTNEAVLPSWLFTAEWSLAPLDFPVGEPPLPMRDFTTALVRSIPGIAPPEALLVTLTG